jgi:tetratricopeptide (TPR) repeat protein
MEPSERLKTLLQMWEQEPGDAFLAYALATEYRLTDQAKAREYYEYLLATHPDYTATYYHLAALYHQLGETALAANTYELGLSACRRMGDRHALNELQRAYQDFEDELE